jgi:hypothetical protein
MEIGKVDEEEATHGGLSMPFSNGGVIPSINSGCSPGVAHKRGLTGLCSRDGFNGTGPSSVSSVTSLGTGSLSGMPRPQLAEAVDFEDYELLQQMGQAQDQPRRLSKSLNY